jgi:phosphatidylinositol kinase/protein kinase (PI-3  family)
MLDKCGLIEFVNNTIVFKSIMENLYSDVKIDFSVSQIVQFQKEIFVNKKDIIERSKKSKSEKQLELHNASLTLFNHNTKYYRPIFHKWLLNQFNNPAKWFQSRLNYSR